MNVIFFFHTDLKAFELKVNWTFPFVPEVGDSIDLLHFFNESDIELAQRIETNSEDEKQSNLMKILRYDIDVFEVESRIWISDGVKLLLTESYFDNLSLRFTFPDWSKDDLQLGLPDSFYNSHVKNYDKQP